MALAVVLSRASIGVEAPLVRVETHLSAGLPAFNIVGLPETAVKESKERVRSAILNSNLDFPVCRITINLAPADLPKSGGRFDLAIAIGILVASGQVETGDECNASQALADKLANIEYLAELALTGSLCHINGLLPAALAAKGDKRQLVVPVQNRAEASLLGDTSIMSCGHLLDLCAFLAGKAALETVRAAVPLKPVGSAGFADIIGQFQARRAMMIAAGGRHNLLMKGPPGTGKTLLASRLCGLLPALSREQSLESAAIRSIAGENINPDAIYHPPFRAPHHTCSAVALVGGGSKLHVGEISLAHNGVLFLDELPEFSPRVLEVLREPMESGCIRISRAAYQVCLPARFQLLAAMNPCPCGYFGDKEYECRCTIEKARSYQQRVSGPLLDRIDIHLEVRRLTSGERQQLLNTHIQGAVAGVAGEEESTGEVLEQIAQCIKIQQRRQGKYNADLDNNEIKQFCMLDKESAAILEIAMQKLKLSTRSCFRVLKLARTIADMATLPDIQAGHIKEAIQYRLFDRQ